MSSQKVNISEAAKLVNKSPKTLYAAIKSGKLSATSNNNGQKLIEISELIRVYGELKQDKNDQPINNELLELRHKVELLTKENENLNLRLADKDKNLNDLRQTTQLLEHYKQESSKGLFYKIFKQW